MDERTRRYRNTLKGLSGVSGYQLLCANCNFIKRIENKECRGPGKRGRK